jgi:hypothetical protein
MPRRFPISDHGRKLAVQASALWFSASVGIFEQNCNSSEICPTAEPRYPRRKRRFPLELFQLKKDFSGGERMK